ncbi:MAG: amino acid permease [Flavobacteriales bacterium]|nr:amino acid permease [Flavobacteriales bacterium]
MSEPRNQLRKSFTLFGLTMIAVSASFGSGIFFSVSQTAQQVPVASWIIAVWIAGGIITLTGALSFAELGAMFPGTGGVYIYLRKAYGDLIAFLYGWASLTIITSGAIAGLAIAFVNNIDFFFGFSDTDKLLLGVATIIILTAINIFNSKVSEAVAGGGTLLKIVGVLIIIIIGLFFSEQSEALVQYSFESSVGWEDFGMAMVGAMWAYGGWHYTATLAGETENPAQKIPRAMLIGSVIITLIYVAVNWSYLQVLSPNELAMSESPATEIVSRVIPNGSALMAGLIALSVFVTASIYTATAPRIYFRMAEDGLFFPWLAKVHPQFRVPLRAIVIQGAWAIVLLVGWREFADVITYVTVADWVFLLLAGIAVFIFRVRKQTTELEALDSPLKDERPHAGFKIPLYPVTPIIYVLMVLFFIAAVMIAEPKNAMAFAAVIASGLLANVLFRKWRMRQD